MSVLDHLKENSSENEFEQTRSEYLEETELLRSAAESMQISLANEAKRIMKDKGISQNELQRQLKISSRTMDGIIHGKANPTFSTIVKLTKLSGRIPKVSWG